MTGGQLVAELSAGGLVLTSARKVTPGMCGGYYELKITGGESALATVSVLGPFIQTDIVTENGRPHLLVTNVWLDD